MLCLELGLLAELTRTSARRWSAGFPEGDEENAVLASDGRTYQRQGDGEWLHDGWIYDSLAKGNVRDELNGTLVQIQALQLQDASVPHRAEQGTGGELPGLEGGLPVVPRADPSSSIAPVLADNPAHADFQTYQRIHAWVAGTGNWDDEGSRNVSAALYRRQVEDPLVKRVDAVTGQLGKDGEENVFAVYKPFGEQAPFFVSCVDGLQARHQPAEQSLLQAEMLLQAGAQSAAQELNLRQGAHPDPARQPSL